MSLYYETAPYLSSSGNSASLKFRLFESTNEQNKSSPKQIYALAIEAASWSPVLAEVIESSQLFDLERKVGYIVQYSFPSKLLTDALGVICDIALTRTRPPPHPRLAPYQTRYLGTSIACSTAGRREAQGSIECRICKGTTSAGMFYK